PYSILFRGCSFLIVYEAGVLSAMQKLSPDILKCASRIYGSSSGSIIGTAGLCECDIGKGCACLFLLKECMETLFSGLKSSLWGLVPGGKVLKNLRKGLEKCLPANAHELVSGKLHIVLTRVRDWRAVTVSEFASREDLIQAVLCSCCIPGYFGFVLSPYHGVYYVDGELAMWTADFVSKTTITVSAFAGEYDICPKDGPAAFLTFQISDCILEISKRNICRLKHL
ncbi:PLPL1 protein, partial [Serilophus lunatus]|nr:PLPL1 protein [Serilophus lunatus]